MAYIPDEWVMRRLDIAQSAQKILFYYCARADQDTGETNVSPEKTSQDLGMRKDHVNEQDRKLIRAKFITISTSEKGGRIVRMLSPWQPRAERNRQSAQITEKKTTSQDLGKQGSKQSVEKKATSQDLGKVTQNLGKVTQNLGAHIRKNQPMNQPMNHEEHGAGAPSLSSQIQEIFSYWQTRLNHPDAKLTPEREAKIRARFKSYTIEQIKTAIDGCALSPFHMGRNDNRMVYDDLTLICRSDSKLEMFISIVRKNGNSDASKADGANKTTGDNRTTEDFGIRDCPVI